MRKSIIALLFVILLTSFPTISFAGLPDTVSVEKAVSTANSEILKLYGRTNYYDINRINKATYRRYGVLAYGSPYGEKDVYGEPRYLGTTPDGEDFPNFKRQPDSSSSKKFNVLNWITDPWDSPRVRMVYNNVTKSDYDDYRPLYLEQFKRGMELYSSARYDSSIFTPWEKYYHIVSPPTQYSYGVAWMWHIQKSDNTLWYVATVLTPTEFVSPAPKQPLDTVRVFYKDQANNDLLPMKTMTPTGEGPFSITAAAVPGMTPDRDKTSVDIARTNRTIDVVFKYKASPTPEPPKQTPTPVSYFKPNVVHVLGVDTGKNMFNREMNKLSEVVINGQTMTYLQGYTKVSGNIAEMGADVIYQTLPEGASPTPLTIPGYYFVPKYTKVMDGMTVYAYMQIGWYDVGTPAPSFSHLYDLYQKGTSASEITSLVAQFKENRFYNVYTGESFRAGDIYEDQVYMSVLPSGEAFKNAVLSGLR